MARAPKKPPTASAKPATPLTYYAWRDAAEHELIERHGIRTNVRAKSWREWYIKNMTPSEATDRAAADHDTLSPPFVGRRKR
jgi:hypothetical protein